MAVLGRGEPALVAAIEELQREVSKLNRDYVVLNTLHKEPERLVEGLLALADGVNWNPNSGGGVYVYRNGAWEKL